MFIHLVYFWLKEGSPAGEREAIMADARDLLKRIETVEQLWAGRPAMTPRDIVDNSYDVGLCVVLKDSAGHDVYQAHPLHLQFIANHKINWKQVQVYDFVAE